MNQRNTNMKSELFDEEAFMQKANDRILNKKKEVGNSNEMKTNFLINKDFFESLYDLVIEKIENNKDSIMSEKSIELRGNKDILDYLKENFETTE